MPLLPALHERHPGLELELLLTDAMVDLVLERLGTEAGTIAAGAQDGTGAAPGDSPRCRPAA